MSGLEMFAVVCFGVALAVFVWFSKRLEAEERYRREDRERRIKREWLK